MILDNYSKFLDDWLLNIKNSGIDTSNMPLDHLGYSVSTKDEYDNAKKELLGVGNLIREVIISERRVGVFELTDPLSYKTYSIKAIELIEPKKNEETYTGFEHGEFTVNSFEALVRKYPKLPWDTSNAKRPDFPRLKLVLKNKTELKFNLESILEN